MGEGDQNMAPYNEEAENNFLNPINDVKPHKAKDQNHDMFPEYASSKVPQSKLDFVMEPTEAMRQN
jgi:hypothetical protein